MEILQILEQNVREYIDEYDGENKCFPVTSSDKYIYKMEEAYTNGYCGVRLDSREQAKRMVSKALSEGTSMNRSIVLANMLRTSKPDMQDEILSKHGSSNYWVQRAVAALAEENGIPVTDLPLDSSLDVKLSILDQLSGQLDLLLEHYSLTANTREASED